MTTALGGSNNVSVYVLRERLQESFEKRQNLKKEEERILKETIQGLPYTETMLKSSETLYSQAFDGILKGTEGYENLQSWRNMYLNRDHS